MVLINLTLGSSINLSVRLSQYYNLNLLTKFRKNSLIHKALLKYGYSKFKLEILEYCDRNDAVKREQYYIDPPLWVDPRALRALGSNESGLRPRTFNDRRVTKNY